VRTGSSVSVMLFIFTQRRFEAADPLQ